MKINLRSFKIFLLLIILFPFLLVLKLIYPFFKIHFGKITSDNMGRYSIEYALIESINSKKSFNEINLFYLNGNSVNKFFDKYVKRNIIINPLVKYFYIANKYLYKNDQLDFNLKYNLTNRDDKGILYNSDFKLRFLEEEDFKGKSFLKKIGHSNQKKIVCLIVRDKDYLNNLEPNKDWSYHDHRNSNINNYIKSVKWLCDNDFFVIRMGKVTNTKLNFKHNNYFDYSYSKDKSDLLDIWLFANCYLCISTGTGIDFISLINKKPIFYSNYIPIHYFISFSNCFTSPKKLYWKDNNKELVINDYLINNFNSANLLHENKIVFKDLSEDEILIDLKDYLKIIKDKTINSDLPHNKLFFNKLLNNKSKENTKFSFYFFHPKTFISYSWFKRVSKQQYN